jgi:hypothetical protein
MFIPESVGIGGEDEESWNSNAVRDAWLAILVKSTGRAIPRHVVHNQTIEQLIRYSLAPDPILVLQLLLTTSSISSRVLCTC